MSALRELIASLIAEMAMMQASAQRDAALLVKQRGSSVYFFLYKPNFFTDKAKFAEWRREYGTSFDAEEFLEESLFPSVYTGDKPKGPIAGLIAEDHDGVWEVQFSRAEPGTGAGPMMYEIAMGLLGWCTADREKVSSEASSVWKKFYDRDDVAKKKLPLAMRKNGSEPWLDFAYKLKKGVGQNFGVMRSYHRAAVEGYSSMASTTKSTMEPREIEDTLVRLMLQKYNLDF